MTTPAARLIRYVPAGALPGSELLAVYDPNQNLLVVNKEEFDKLTRAGQSAVLRTHRTLTVGQA